MKKDSISFADGVDFHSHVLPAIDDGSRDAEMSVMMLKMLYSQGVRCVVATPHFYPHQTNPNEFIRRRQESADRLLRAVAEEDRAVMPQLFVGAEVAYFKGMSRSDAIEGLCIEGTALLLLEMPFDRWGSDELRELFAIKARLGLTPVIAHIERHLPYQKKDIIQEIVNGEALIQCNAEAFLNFGTRGRMLKMLSEGKVDVIGSDCHDLCNRAPRMSSAFKMIEKKLGSETLGELCAREKMLLEGAKRIL